MLKIYKDTFYKLLYVACVTVIFLNIYELTFLVWSLTAIITLSNKYSFTILKYIFCFGAIFMIAFMVSFFNDESTYNFFRDIAYLLKPILGLLVGYQIAKKINIGHLSLIIYTGVIIAASHLLIVFFTFLKFHTITVNILREYCGYFSDYEIYVLLILLFYKKFNVNYSKKTLYIFIAILSLSSFLYLSRTNFIQFIILFIAIKGYFVLNKKSLAIIFSFLIVVFSGYAAIYYSNPQRTGKGIEAFLYKIKIAPLEPFKTKINKDDWKDFNDNYRSYENILTFKQVTYEGDSTILFGKGLGSTINLGREVWSNDGAYIQYIPILHNGFATIFLKSGLIGVLLLLLFIYLLLKHKKSENQLIQSINFLLIGSAIFLIVSNWVFMGLYLKLDNKSILIGFLLCYREILIKRENELSTTSHNLIDEKH
ncbi:hypothetical protein [Flavobacterium sp.]|uniref:hypothetical protein n=1 Tax=Flavobacterium sp. TaxID=239 RepID=UPI000EB9A02E|nr:hypothetical protein [Flavobacterium sp.]HCQ12498.1 hypothetical protein [Flavobacterium sp.]